MADARSRCCVGRFDPGRRLVVSPGVEEAEHPPAQIARALPATRVRFCDTPKALSRVRRNPGTSPRQRRGLLTESNCGNILSDAIDLLRAIAKIAD
jgi:hypothetical protein